MNVASLLSFSSARGYLGVDKGEGLFTLKE